MWKAFVGFGILCLLGTFGLAMADAAVWKPGMLGAIAIIGLGFTLRPNERPTDHATADESTMDR